MSQTPLKARARQLSMLTMPVLALTAVLHGNAPDTTVAHGCALDGPQGTEHSYTITGRVRPFLVWLGRHEVGNAWFRASAPGADARRLELLIGTDPDRAPMRINRWGYIVETVCGPTAALLGIMTQSDEETVEQASAAVASNTRTHSYQAIRTTIRQETAQSDLLRLAAPSSVTYRDVDAVLRQLPATGTRKHVTVPKGTESGFLGALTGLMRDSADRYATSGRPPGRAHRVYLHDGRLYDLTMQSSQLVSDLRAGPHAYGRAIESEVEIKNTLTGSTTEFRIAYGVSGADRAVPIRVVYRPRWWLELELTRDAAAKESRGPGGEESRGHGAKGRS